MSDFDPYLQWLGIRDPERPINYYRLLGLDLYEVDQQIISMAADRQMEHVRSFQNGPHGRACNDLLNELAVARRRLLTVEQKQEYDNQLRAGFDGPALLPTGSQVIKTDPNSRQKQARRERRAVAWGLIGWVAGAIAAVGVGGFIVTSGIIPGVGISKLIPDSQSASGPSTSGVDSAANSNDNSPNLSPANSPTDTTATGATNSELDDRPPTSPANVPRESGTRPPAVNLAARFPLYKGPGDFGKHRKPDSNSIKLIGQVAGAVEPAKFEFFGQTIDEKIGNRDYRELAKGGGLLIGVIVSQFQNGDLKSLQPVFLERDGAQVGKEFGVPLNRHLILAQPGFAVGSLEVAGSNPVKGIRLTFMKIGAAGLDTKDNYVSAWFGNSDVATTKSENAQGMPIVGVQGRLLIRLNVCSIGLIGIRDLSVVSPLAALPTKPVTPEAVPGNIAAVNPDPAANLPPTSSITPPGDPTATIGITPPIPTKLSVPSAKEIGQEMYKFMSAYRTKFENAKTPEAKTRLAGELFQDGRMSTEPVERYVILNQAWELAIAIGDAELALTPLREINEQYEIDFVELAKKTMVGAVRNVAPGTEAAYKQVLDNLIQEMLDQQNFDGAGWFAKQGRELAKLAGRAEVFKTYQKQEKIISQLEQMWKANTKAEKLLKTTPGDQAAHQTRGDFLFAIEKDLVGAVAHWAQSGEPLWQEIAALEIQFKSVDTPNKELVEKLAAAWDALGARNSSPRDAACLNRAKELKQESTQPATK